VSFFRGTIVRSGGGARKRVAHSRNVIFLENKSFFNEKFSFDNGMDEFVVPSTNNNGRQEVRVQENFNI
jgi:hypothetical protein